MLYVCTCSQPLLRINRIPFFPVMQYMSSEMAAMQSPPAYPSPGPNMANYPVAMYPSGRPYPVPGDKRESVKGRKTLKYDIDYPVCMVRGR